MQNIPEPTAEVVDQAVQELNRMFQDTAQKQQLADLAGQFGLTLPENLSGLDQLLDQGTSSREEALLHALQPYLRPGRQAKLQKAMDMVRMTHLAGAALSKGGGHV